MNNLPTESTEIESTRVPAPLIVKVWHELTRASKDRHHHWKTPALATLGLDGQPQVRTVVLRHADPTQWTLDVYTDSRSPKYHELTQHGHAQLVFWSAKLRWQLRVAVQASLHRHDDCANAAWERVRQSPSSKDYLSKQAPGEVLVRPAKDANIADTARDTALNHHLAVLRFQIISMDWLALAKDQHHRAQILPSGIVTPLSP